MYWKEHAVHIVIEILPKLEELDSARVVLIHGGEDLAHLLLSQRGELPASGELSE